MFLKRYLFTSARQKDSAENTKQRNKHIWKYVYNIFITRLLLLFIFIYHSVLFIYDWLSLKDNWQNKDELVKGAVLLFLQLIKHMYYTSKTFSLWIRFSYQNFEIRMISSHDFCAFVNDQLFGEFRICRPGFIDKNKDHFISWDIDLLSTFKNKSAWQKVVLSLFTKEKWFVIFKIPTSQKNWYQLLMPFFKKYLWREFQLNTVGKGGKVLMLLYSNLLWKTW